MSDAGKAWSPERRRTVRLTRSGLLQWKLEDVDRPAIKIAETPEEIKGAFSLVHNVYRQSKYLDKDKPNGLLYGIHSLLPNTTIFIAKSYLDIISTLTEIFDSPEFGLPMDSIYKEELDALRAQGRRVTELSALATPRERRWRNIFLHLCRVMYHYSLYRGVDDLCITVNPKHVRFYKDILLFEEFGPVRHYPRVNAPAVALRVRLDTGEEKLKEAYSALDFDCNLHAYFHRMTGQKAFGAEDDEVDEPADPPSCAQGRDIGMLRELFDQEESLLQGLTPEQRKFFNKTYPGLNLP